MMTKKVGEDNSLIKSKNGFTFKRKRQDNAEDVPPLQRVKKEEPKKIQPEIKVDLKDPTLFFKETLNQVSDIFSDQIKNVSQPQQQVRKTVQVGGGSKDKDIFVKPASREKESKDENKEEKEVTELVRALPKRNSPKISPQELENMKKNLIKLPEYPSFFIPIEFEIEIYDKENPYKRLIRMVGDICTKEETMLQNNYKENQFFLKIGKILARHSSEPML